MQSTTDSEITTDGALITAVLGGKQDQFEELVLRYQNMVYGVAWSQLGDVDMAEEAAQQTFVKAYCYLATLREPSKFRPWLARIARNVSVTIGRKRSRELSNRDRWHLELAANENQTAETPTLAEELRETLTKLSEPHREVLTLFYLEGQSVKEVSLALDLSESTVKTRLSRARKALRSELEKRMDHALDELRPSNNLAPLIMAGIPASAPLGATLKLAALGKTASTTGKFFVPILFPFISLILFFILVSSGFKGQAENYQDGSEHDFRRKLTLQFGLMIMGMALIVVTISHMLTNKFGPQAFFQYVSIFCFYGLWLAGRQLRVNCLPISIANFISMVIYCVIYILIGFFDFSFQIFFVGMLGINIMLYRVRKSVPLRRDYNLFLRAATDGLDVTNSPIEDDLELIQSQLVSYAKFLGEHWIIRDYQLHPSEIELFLPAAKQTPFTELLSAKWFSSRILISQSGTCEVFIAPRDLKAINKVTNSVQDSEQLQQSVKRALRESLQQFSLGEFDQAKKRLCRLEEQQVFKLSPEKEKSFKRVYQISIASSILCVLLWALAIGLK